MMEASDSIGVKVLNAILHNNVRLQVIYKSSNHKKGFEEEK